MGSAWLRAECSIAHRASCELLGVAEDASLAEVREAYLRLARQTHPDCRSRRIADSSEMNTSEDYDEFSALHEAYRHLALNGGRGSQRNPRHEERLMLMPPDSQGNCKGEQAEDLQLFKARLLTVIREFGVKGFPVSSLRKKYAQVWSGAALPSPTDFGLRKGCGVLEMLRTVASDVVHIE